MSGGPQIVNHSVEYGVKVPQARSAASGAVCRRAVSRVIIFYQYYRRNAAGQIDA
jgi:hypothetical protein